MRQITSSTLSNQSIATALLCATYTADADRDIFFRLFADQVAGNGTYSAYITIQRLGVGSAYEVQPRTSPSVASGVTSIGFSTVIIPVKNTDVVKVYLIGLAGDTTTPDIITEVWEADYARPITAGQYSTNIDSSGRVLLQPTQTGVTIPTVTTVGTLSAIANDAITAASIAADAGVELGTAVWASGSRTLSSFGTLVADIWANVTRTLTSGGGASAAEVWAYAVRTLTQVLVSTDNTNPANTLTTRRGDYYSKSLTDLGNITAYTKLWFDVKETEDGLQPDDDALIQIVVGSGFAITGLIYLNGEPAGSNAWGSLTVDVEATADITIVLEADATVLLPPGRYFYGIKALVGGNPTTLVTGVFIVYPGYTTAVS